jgi:glutamine amidotransferase
MKVSIFDYGAGNLHSLAKAVAACGAEPVIEADLAIATGADALILPGVGAFGSAAARMGDSRDAARQAIRGGLPVLGICLGMHLLLDESEEGAGQGLGIIPGRVVKLQGKRVPQIGWNDVEPSADSEYFGNGRLSVAYFANSFICRPLDTASVIAWTTHESERFPAAVRLRNVMGVQFHPEKSSREGVELIGRFLGEAAA